MKERVVKWPEKRRLFTIMFLVIFMITFGIHRSTHAQGWSFSAQLIITGNCAGFNYPLPMISGLPTKSQCESVRQMVLAIEANTGDCEGHFTCTPCTGSDLATSGDLNPGGISNNGQVDGKPIFTPHQSQAAEDFWEDYKQQLQSYGVTSIYGDQLYRKKSEEFEPPPDDSPDNPSNPPPAPRPVNPKTNDQDITYKSIPIMGGSPLTVEEMERQKLIKQFGPGYIDQANMFTNVEDGAINKKEDAHPYIELGRQAAVIGAGFLEAESVTPVVVIIDVLSETMVKPGVTLYNNAFNGTNDVVPGTGEILINTAEKIAGDLVGGKLGEAAENDIKLITNPQVQQEMVRNGVLPGIAAISEKPGQICLFLILHFKLSKGIN